MVTEKSIRLLALSFPAGNSVCRERLALLTPAQKTEVLVCDEVAVALVGKSLTVANSCRKMTPHFG